MWSVVCAPGCCFWLLVPCWVWLLVAVGDVLGVWLRHSAVLRVPRRDIAENRKRSFNAQERGHARILMVSVKRLGALSPISTSPVKGVGWAIGNHRS
jgi:hypothetical protein